MPLLSMTLSRLAQAGLVMLVVAFVAFILSTYVGDPVTNLLGQEATLEDRERLREDLGLNDPVPVQFLRFLGNAVQGEFGISYRLQRPVSDLIAERLPATLELVAVSAVFAIVFGVAFGIFTAIHRDNAATQILKANDTNVTPLRRLSFAIQLVCIAVMATVIVNLAGGGRVYLYSGLAMIGGLAGLGFLSHWALKRAGIVLTGFQFLTGIVNALLARVIMTVSLIGVSLPTFVVGIVLIYIFAVTFNILPSFGRGEVVDLGGWWTTGLLTAEGWRAIILPAITLGLYQLTIILRLIRSEMLEVLRTDYIKFARARGLREGTIYFGHALKNTLLPVITVIGLQIGTLIAFSIITETVFQWPGMGLLFIQAVQVADVPIMSAYLVLVSFVFVLINFLVDMLYFIVDPRLKSDRLVGGGKTA